MSDRKSSDQISRREFLRFTNKASVALISAGGILSVVHPQKVFSALKSGENNKLKVIRPLRNKTAKTNKSRKNKIIVSSTLTFEDQNYLLNSEGSFIWNLCNGRHDLNMVAEALSLKYHKAPSLIMTDVGHFVDALKSLNLIEFVN
jgi:hypothetical protein